MQRKKVSYDEASVCADGFAVLVWRFAQEYAGKEELVPFHAFEAFDDYDLFCEAGLAEKRESGYYIRGQGEHFAWLREHRNGAKRGGKASVMGRIRDEKGRLMPSTHPAPIQVDPAPIQPSSSSSSSKKEKGKSGSSENISENQLVKIWNEHRGTLSVVLGISGKRLAASLARWAEKPDPDYWTGIVKRIASTPFCVGENERKWKADFDFLIRPDTQHKVLEGKYGQAAAQRKLKTLADIPEDYNDI